MSIPIQTSALKLLICWSVLPAVHYLVLLNSSLEVEVAPMEEEWMKLSVTFEFVLLAHHYSQQPEHLHTDPNLYEVR